MITYDHSDAETRFLYEKAGFAAYGAYRAFELEVDGRFEDAKQEAALTFWDLYRQKGSEEYAFVGAKYAAMNFLRGKSPYGCISLDTGHDSNSSPWEERLLAAETGHDDRNGRHWLSDDNLHELVTELFDTPAPRQELPQYRQLLHHQVVGLTLKETATALGKTYNATKALRRRLILKLAEHYAVSPAWEAVATMLGQEEDFDGTVQAISGTPPSTSTVDYNVAILRLLMKGYDTAAIAVELGRTEEGIKGARRDLKRRLVTHCHRMGIEPPKYNRNGGGWRPAHHYAQMGRR